MLTGYFCIVIFFTEQYKNNLITDIRKEKVYGTN